MEESRNSKFRIGELMQLIFKKGGVSIEDQELINKELDKELLEKPFRVAVIGQAGVGKSTTLNSVFGLKNFTSNIAEGTTEIIEKVYPMRDGFNLSLYDMPGLNNDMDKDIIYQEMYQEILPQCDVIVYVVGANTRDFGEDCRILKEVVLPICGKNNIKDNLILAINKIDTVGESTDPNDPDLRWNVIDNIPTQKLGELIKIKLSNMIDKLIDENLIDDITGLKEYQVVFYSAIFNYNLKPFLMAITKAGKRGWIWPATVGLEVVGKRCDLEINNNNSL